MILGTGKRARPVRPDSHSQAQCDTNLRDCPHAFCPRHRPDDYASHMARHATDSF